MSDRFICPSIALLEREAAKEAAEQAIRETREEWLPRLEEARASLDPKTADLLALVTLDAEIRRLRRSLGIKPTPDEIRARTRERVRLHRERKRRGEVR